MKMLFCKALVKCTMKTQTNKKSTVQNKKESNYTQNEQYSNLFEKIVMSRLGYTNTDAIRNL